jgi:hypothetical protein
MPYISTERVKAIREQLKKEFPGWKFSVIRRHHMEVSVSIMSAPLDFGKEYQQVNQYYITEHYQGAIRDNLLKINEIMEASNGTLTIDADYGSIPNYYTSLTIGQWDKPFTLKRL